MTPYTVLFPEVGRGDPGSQPRRPRKSAEATPEASRGDPGRPPRRPWPATALGSLQVLSSGEELGYRLPLAATTGPSVSDARNGCKWTGQRPIQQAHLEAPHRNTENFSLASSKQEAAPGKMLGPKLACPLALRQSHKPCTDHRHLGDPGPRTPTVCPRATCDHKLLRTGKAGLIHLVQPRGSCEHTPVVGPPRASPCPPHTILTNWSKQQQEWTRAPRPSLLPRWGDGT
ncbi:uncharacterized protein LOC113933741 isoform X2 [Zalophus californianus]|uniref:Uncharacterized protein LOC113933741 isoform X2 n=1 Tax=Zalophus californianus TaxID=9704 RepID=A0A6J2EP41_ZALCA|nr:uncharacterized protein LOC113933741 isoform X2 [Zalophus californianus]